MNFGPGDPARALAAASVHRHGASSTVTVAECGPTKLPMRAGSMRSMMG